MALMFNGSKLLPKPACNKVVEGVDPQTKPAGRVTTVDDSEMRWTTFPETNSKRTWN